MSKTYEVKARVVLILPMDEGADSSSDATAAAEDILNEIDEASDVDITDVELIDSDETESEAA